MLIEILRHLLKGKSFWVFLLTAWRKTLEPNKETEMKRILNFKEWWWNPSSHLCCFFEYLYHICTLWQGVATSQSSLHDLVRLQMEWALMKEWTKNGTVYKQLKLCVPDTMKIINSRWQYILQVVHIFAMSLEEIG